MSKQIVENIHWLGHDSFRIEGDDLVVYIDPWKVKTGPKADLILITHEHRDHCSPEDVAKLQKEDTIIVTISPAAKKLQGEIKVVSPGDSVTVKGVPIQVVRAYNVDKLRSPGIPYHPREAGHVGFVFTLGGQRIYHTGDTDPIPEMESVQADVLLVPVSGIYVMTAEEAVQVVNTVQPKVAIPMHVGGGIGSLENAEQFKAQSPLPVEILPLED